MRTVTFTQWKNLAAYLARRAEDTTTSGKLTTSEATALQTFLAGDLPQVWNREAWPVLCDNLEQVTVTDHAFSKRVGTGTEMGDILAVIEIESSPITVTTGTVLPRSKVIELDDRVVLVSGFSSVWVDWQDPAPTPSTVLAYVAASTLPEFLYFPLACRAAGFLVRDEDPVLSAQLYALAEQNLNWQAGRIQVPWWRKSGVEK